MQPLDAGTIAVSSLPASPSGSDASARLRVDQGSVDDQYIGLDRPVTIIGRRQGSDVVIHDTNVSRLHAQIKRDGGRLVIEDTNSSNGTIVNDERIDKPLELRSGDVIRIGDAVFVLEVEEQSPESPESPEGSTMAIDLDSPMTSLGGVPELIPPGLGQAQPNPLTPPPSIMDSSHTALADSIDLEDEVSPPGRSAEARSEAAEASPGPEARPASARAASGSTSAALESLRRELAEVGEELGTFSGTLGSLADRVERLERALDAATGDLDSVADAIRGPDAAVLKELQGIVADIERAAEGPTLDEAMRVLEQLAAQPRDIELLLKLSQQAGAIEGALRIHGRLVAAAPRLRTTLDRLTG
jgi:pSer/pThr/pTyr-binding forkhead associated (FHA) protein